MILIRGRSNDVVTYLNFGWLCQLVLANPGQAVLDKLHASDFADAVGDERIFLTVADAVSTLAPKMEP